MKWTLLIVLIGLVALLFSLNKYSYVHTYTSPDATRAVLIESRKLRFVIDEEKRLKIKLIDLASGKVLAKDRYDVRGVFLHQYIGEPEIAATSFYVEWFADGSVNVMVSDCGCVVQLPSGKHFSIHSPEYKEQNHEEANKE